MRLLILGGTVFLGRHIVECAVERGHVVTLFTRGLHGVELHPDVERLTGNRDGDLAALEGRTWDAVVDTSGYVPRVVGASATMLASAVGTYAFISSVSVYADFSQHGITEDAPVATLDDPSIEVVDGETYGALKALCEQAVERTIPNGCIVIRPGLIVGPNDPSDRFTYWPARIAVGGEVLAPGEPARPVQFVDVRDLAAWVVSSLEDERRGVYNAIGPQVPTTFGDLLETCQAVAAGDARLTWVPEQFLLESGVQPWSELPLWVPDDGAMAGLETVDGSRAFGQGMTCRPMIETVRDTLSWHSNLPSDRTMRAGLTRAREAELLEQWHAHCASAQGARR